MRSSNTGGFEDQSIRSTHVTEGIRTKSGWDGPGISICRCHKAYASARILRKLERGGPVEKGKRQETDSRKQVE